MNMNELMQYVTYLVAAIGVICGVSNHAGNQENAGT